MAIGWVIFIAFVAFYLGMGTASIFAITKIAILEHRLSKREEG